MKIILITTATSVQSNMTKGRNAALSPVAVANEFVHGDHYLLHKKKEKGKEAYLYSAFYILCISQSAQAWIRQFYLQIHHACFSFVCIHQMAPPLTEVRDI